MPPLQYAINSLEDLEDPKQSELYMESDGKFILQVEGVKPLDEFNKVHEALRKERGFHSEWEKKAKLFGEDTPETIADFKTKIAELEASTGNEDIEGVKKSLKEHYEARLTALALESGKKLETSESEKIALGSKLTDFQLEKQLMELCKGVAKPESFTDALSLLKAGVTLDADTGDFVAKDGITLLKEHVATFFKDRPYFVAESESGGATGGKGTPGAPTDWKKMNMTEQAMLIHTNPNLATKLRRKAGMID